MNYQLPFSNYRVSVSIDETAARVSCDQLFAVLSSAVIGGNLRATRHIVNMYVRKGYTSENPEDDLIACAARLGIAEPFVGMMTAAYTQNARVAIESRDGITVAAIVTAGLSNLTAAGFSQPMQILAGTINTIVLIDAALTDAAMANAIITATEAKTLTLIERAARTREGDFASGTSTDSIVIAHTRRGEALRYAGPATIVGHLIARTVREAMTQSLIAREQSL